MKLSIDIYEIRHHFGEKQGFKELKNAGFDSIDYSFYWLDEAHTEKILGENHIEYAKSVRASLDEIGLTCNQAHAPFEFRSDEDTIDISNPRYLRIIRSMESAAIMGAQNIIIHSINPFPGQSLFDTNYAFYKSFQPYCEKFGIHVSIENLFGQPYDEARKRYIGNRFDRPESMMELIRALDSEWFNVCIDVGHAAVTDIHPEDFIRALDAKTLKALHIQDNNYEGDQHNLPYMGKINWDNVTKALHDIGYMGDMTFEVFGFFRSLGQEQNLVKASLPYIAAVGRQLIQKVQNA